MDYYMDESDSAGEQQPMSPQPAPPASPAKRSLEQRVTETETDISVEQPNIGGTEARLLAFVSWLCKNAVFADYRISPDDKAAIFQLLGPQLAQPLHHRLPAQL